jgi:hypothetical protein
MLVKSRQSIGRCRSPCPARSSRRPLTRRARARRACDSVVAARGGVAVIPFFGGHDRDRLRRGTCRRGRRRAARSGGGGGGRRWSRRRGCGRGSRGIRGPRRGRPPRRRPRGPSRCAGRRRQQAPPGGKRFGGQADVLAHELARSPGDRCRECDSEHAHDGDQGGPARSAHVPAAGNSSTATAPPPARFARRASPFQARASVLAIASPRPLPAGPCQPAWPR